MKTKKKKNTKKTIKTTMTEKIKQFTSKTVFGFTIKEISTFIGLLFTGFLIYMNLNVKILAVESSNEQTKKDIIELRNEIEENKKETTKQFDEMKKENREDHLLLSDKLDKILFKVK